MWRLRHNTGHQRIADLASGGAELENYLESKLAAKLTKESNAIERSPAHSRATATGTKGPKTKKRASAPALISPVNAGDRHELGGAQTRAADKRAVNVFDQQQFRGIGGRDRAAIENARAGALPC